MPPWKAIISWRPTGSVAQCYARAAERTDRIQGERLRETSEAAMSASGRLPRSRARVKGKPAFLAIAPIVNSRT